MTVLSLREAAQEAGTSKSTILRAIQAGRLSAPRNDDGGYAIDPAELFRVYPPKPMDDAADQSVSRGAGHDASAQAPGASDAGAAELAVKRVALEAELRGLKDLLAEVRQSRDDWRDQAARLTHALPDPRASKANAGGIAEHAHKESSAEAGQEKVDAAPRQRSWPWLLTGAAAVFGLGGLLLIYHG